MNTFWNKTNGNNTDYLLILTIFVLGIVSKKSTITFVLKRYEEYIVSTQCLCVCVCLHVCVCVSLKWLEEIVRSPESGIMITLNTQNKCWLMNLGPHWEQNILLIPEPFFQSQLLWHKKMKHKNEYELWAL